MFFLIEFDRHYAGFGIDWHENIKGFRLGWFGFHIFTVTFIKFVDQIEKNAVNPNGFRAEDY